MFVSVLLVELLFLVVVVVLLLVLLLLSGGVPYNECSCETVTRSMNGTHDEYVCEAQR